jgi:hypothetical protein
MSGLILAGIGRGLSNAATTFGNTMVRRYEAEQSLAREEARDARKLQAAEDREEKAKQRMISEISAAREGGEQINRERVAGQVLAQGGANIAGDSPVMDPAEFASILKENPQYEQVYRQAGLVKDAMDPRAQRATDEYNAALAAGASSATLQGLEKAKKSVLDQIKEEGRAAERERKDKLERDRFEATIGIQQQRADAATARVTSGPSQSEVSSAESALNNAMRRVSDAWDARNPETMQDKVDPAAQAARAARRDREVNSNQEVLRARQRLEGLYGGNAPAQNRPGPVNPGNNTGTNRAPLESFMRQ